MTSRGTPAKTPPARLSRLTWIVGIVLAAGILAAILLRRPERPPASGAGTVQTPPAGAGTLAPAFLLETVAGGKTGPQEHRGKVVILNFWATWCPPCKREIPDFIVLQSLYGGRGLQILGVALDDPSPVKEFCETRGINYPVVYGTDDVARLYGGISGIPTTYVIDRSGSIVRRYEGLRSREVFEDDIRQLLSN